MYHATITIRLEDSDAAGVLFFARLPALAHRVYEAFLEEQGFGVRQLLDDGALILPIVHADCDYRAPLRPGDRVTVAMEAPRVGDTSFETCYRFEREGGGDCGTVRLVHAVRKAADGSKAALPPALLQALSDLSDPSR